MGGRLSRAPAGPPRGLGGALRRVHPARECEWPRCDHLRCDQPRGAHAMTINLAQAAAPPSEADQTYVGYAYAYPHKTAYRRLDPVVPLAQAWAGEPSAGRFLYVHIPFCEMRCGFCNLFTTASAS